MSSRDPLLIIEDLEEKVIQARNQLYQAIKSKDSSTHELGRNYDALLIKLRQALDQHPVFFGRRDSELSSEEFENLLKEVRYEIKWTIDEMTNWRVKMRQYGS